ncbi:MAG: AMP-binding protein [Clostridia bacterium]|nr:AMP-binding protein [Clostridia bacterium]
MQIPENEYLALKEKEMEWAKNVIKTQEEDKRPGVQYLRQRPVTDIKHMLKTTAELYPDKIAFMTKFKKGPYVTITHKENYDNVNALGTAFIKHGLKDKRISPIGETNYQWSVSYLAAVSGTGVVVPLDKELPYNDLKHLVKEAETECVIFDKKREATFIKMMAENETPLKMLVSQERTEHEEVDGVMVYSFWKLIEEGKELIASGDRSFLDAQIDHSEMAIIIFTSGTTGMAKGIMLSHKNIASELMISPVMVDANKDDIFFSVLPIHHTYECTCDFLMPLYLGATIAHCEGLKYITKNIQEAHPTLFLAVPAILEALHKAVWKGIKAKGKEKTVRTAMKVSNFLRKLGIDITDKLFGEIKQTLGGNMKMFIVGGAAINPQILEDFQSFGIMALQGYGLSEAAPMGALNPDNKPKSNSIGLPFPGCGAMIADKGADGIGEICIKGDNIMLGYYKNPEATAEVIKDGWLYTGDLGYIDDEGYIIITGRKKNVIITKNGKNVFPEELEYQLSLFDTDMALIESMVYEEESDNKDDTLIAASIYPDWAKLKELLGEKAEDDSEVKKYLWTVVDKVNEENPGYKMIRKINLRHTELEKNTSKKIKRFVKENKMEM